MKLRYDELLSNFAVNCKLRHYIVAHMGVEIQTGGSVDGLDHCYMNEGSA